MSTELAKSVGTSVAVKAEASAELLERMSEARDNLQGIDNFKLPRAKMTPAGIELSDGDEPIEEFEGIILHKTRKNVFYAKTYNSNDVTPPDCFSNNGVNPDPSVKEPQNKTCAGCPKAEFGTSAQGTGKACRNLVPLYVLLSDESIMPRQITVTPSSLKALSQYLMDLTERGVNFRKIKTKFSLYKGDRKDTYLKFKFSKGEKIDAQKAADIEF